MGHGHPLHACHRAKGSVNDRPVGAGRLEQLTTRGIPRGATVNTANARARTPRQAGGQHEPTVSAHAVRAAPIEQP